VNTEHPSEHFDASQPGLEKARQRLEADNSPDGDPEAGVSAEARVMLRRAKRAFSEATTYWDTSLKPQFETNLHHFRATHPPHSKYFAEAYRHRSKLYRPKLRAAVRNHEAAAAAAFFTSRDYLSVSAENQNDAEQAKAAKIRGALLQLRLERSIPWVLTALGAWQDTHVYGYCVSYQNWRYETRRVEDVFDATEDDLPPGVDSEKVVWDEETDRVSGYREEREEVVDDKPEIVLVAPDHIYFDPNSDWRDPVGSSSYVIEQIPMTVGEVLRLMEQEDPKTRRPLWRRYSEQQIQSAGRYSVSQTSVELARQGRNRTDPADVHTADQLALVWVHRVILKYDGDDYLFYTIGSDLLLSEPEPLSQSWPFPGRPYRLGISMLEAHRAIPSGSVELGADVQENINELANQRIDNVRLALNKRYLIRRQKQGNIDLMALQRSVPGGGIMLDSPQDDVKVLETGDVTGSSYTEQSHLSNEMDELLGNFSQSSILASRSLNESVGGMNLLASGANLVQNLSMLLFVYTWMQPVLADLDKLVSHYESDPDFLSLASAGVELSDELLRAPLNVRVDLGMGNTSPAQKVERLTLALNTLLMVPGVRERLNEDEVSAEVFGYLGFDDGDRFLRPAKEVPPPPPDPRTEVEMAKLEFAAQKHEDDIALARERLQIERELGLFRIAADKQKTVRELEVSLGIATQRDRTNRDAIALREMNKRVLQSGRNGTDEGTVG
jgi:hypothetical protein